MRNKRCECCNQKSNKRICKECADIIAKYTPKQTNQVEADGEVTLYESSLGWNPFKE